MAWFSGTYACGHAGRVQIYGPIKQRQWKADREFSRLCPDCRAKEWEQEKERRFREAVENARKMNLPALEGTPKQIAWAETLRYEFIRGVDEFFDSEKRRQAFEKIHGIDVETVRDFIIANRTEAKYYIDRRHIRPVGIIENEIKNAKEEAK